jgi:type IV fimbrial biogenesis protein FimT
MASTMCTHAVSFGHRTPPRANSGFSLVELMVVAAIAAVLLAITVPSMGAMLSTQRTVSLTNIFLHSLHLARSEAIKRNGRAVVCKSANGQQCTTAGGWEQGWIVFHDVNNNAQLDGDELVVQQHGPAPAGMRLRGNAPVVSYVSYSAGGTAKMMSGAFQAGTFTLCPAAAGNGADVRLVVLGGPGRPRVQKGTPANCP